MKKLLLTLTILLALSTNSYAAIGAATVWEVRTTGADTNGGGYDDSVAVAGTDYSQQDASQDSGVDLACADGDADPPTVTSATHNFVAADEGNIIQIHEAGTGFTLGFYLIDDTAGNGAILDRPCGNDGALANGDWDYGGALATLTKVAVPLVAKNKIWVKTGTYAETLTLSVAGSTYARIIWEGYDSSRGDEPKDDARPVIDGGGARANCLNVSDKDLNLFKFFRFANATGDNVTASNGSDGVGYYFCKSSSSGDNGFGETDNTFFMSVEFNNNTAAGFSNGGISASYDFFYCYFHDNGAHGAFGDSTNNVLNSHYSIYDTNSDDGFECDGKVDRLIGNVAFNNTGDGFHGSQPQSNSVAYWYNNVSRSNGDHGFEHNGDTSVLFDYNLYNNNSTAGLSGIDAGSNDVTTNPLFNNETGGDFTYSSGSPALAAGYPQTMPGATGDYGWNIGIAQDDAETFTYGFMN